MNKTKIKFIEENKVEISGGKFIIVRDRIERADFNSSLVQIGDELFREITAKRLRYDVSGTPRLGARVTLSRGWVGTKWHDWKVIALFQ